MRHGTAIASRFTTVRGQLDQVKHRFSHVKGTDYAEGDETARNVHNPKSAFPLVTLPRRFGSVAALRVTWSAPEMRHGNRSQGAEDGQSIPMPEGHGTIRPLTTPTTAIQAGHVGLHATFIQQYQ